MKYFNITENPERVGMREMVPRYEYDVDLPNAQAKLSATTFPDFEPTFSKLYIERVTPIIDNVGGIGGVGFICAKGVVAVLQKFKLGAHRFYPLSAFYWNSKEPVDTQYYWLQLVSEAYGGWVDYSKSEFKLVEFMSRKNGVAVPIASADQLSQTTASAKEKDQDLLCTKLCFTDSFPNYDLFYMDELYTHTFPRPLCSERLKQTLEDFAPHQFLFTEVPS